VESVSTHISIHQQQKVPKATYTYRVYPSVIEQTILANETEVMHSKMLNPYKKHLLSKGSNCNNSFAGGSVAGTVTAGTGTGNTHNTATTKPAAAISLDDKLPKAMVNPYKKTSQQKQPRCQPHAKNNYTKPKHSTILNPYKRKRTNSNPNNDTDVNVKGMNDHALVNRNNHIPSRGISMKPLPKFQNPYLKKKRPLPSSLSSASALASTLILTPSLSTSNMIEQQTPVTTAQIPKVLEHPEKRDRDAIGLNTATETEKASGVQEVIKEAEKSNRETIANYNTTLSMTQYEDEHGFDYGTQWNDSASIPAGTANSTSTSHSRKLFQANDDQNCDAIHRKQKMRDDIDSSSLGHLGNRQSTSIPEVMPKTNPLHEQQETPTALPCLQPHTRNSYKETTMSQNGRNSARSNLPRAQASATTIPRNTPPYQTPLVSSRRKTSDTTMYHNKHHQNDSARSSLPPGMARKMPSVTPHKSALKSSRDTMSHHDPENIQNTPIPSYASRLATVSQASTCTPTPHKLKTPILPSQRYNTCNNKINQYRQVVPHSSRKAVSTRAVASTPHAKIASSLSASKNPYAKRGTRSMITTTPHPKTPARSTVTPFKSPSPSTQKKGFRWKNNVTASPYPEMMFLVEAMKEAKDSLHKSSIESVQRMVQIQGIVVTGPYNTRISYNENDAKDQESASTSVKAKLAFCLDDGTSMIDVLYASSYESKDDQGNESEKIKLLSSLSLPPLREVTKGDRVDCRGFIQYVQLESRNDDAKDQTPVPCFMVDSVSFVSDPNHEILRMAQISYARRMSSKDRCKAPVGFSRPQKVIQGMHVFGNPKGRKSSPIIYEPNKVFVDLARLMHLINLSKPKGLTFHHLETIFHLNTVQDICALRNSLKMLQANYEIYVSRTGSYLPM